MRRASIGGALLTLGLLAGACGGDDGGSSSTTTAPDAGEPVAGGDLTYGLNAETDGFDPTSNRWGDSGHVVALAIFDRLAMHDDQGAARPYLAEKITSRDGFTIWEIVLREGVTFHDGTPVDAEAVKMNLDAHRSSGLTKPGFAPVSKVEVVDDLTLKITMDRPWASFPQILTTQVGAIAAPAMLEDPDGGAHPIGSGPFRFVSWKRDEELRVKRNEDYWREGYPYLEDVVFRVVPDELSRNQALITGDLDAAMVNTAPQVVALDELAANGEMQVFHNDGGDQAEAFIVLNTADPELADVRVRRALALATNREDVVNLVYEGLYELATGPFAPSSPWFVETDYPTFDLPAARALVEEVEDELGPIELSFQGPPSSTNLQLRQLLIDQWKAAGIDATAVSFPSAENILNVIAGNYQVSTWGHFDSPHPDGDYVWWHSSNSHPAPALALNYARNEDPVIDDALDEARASGDPEVEKELYGVLQEQLAKDLPYLWLYHTDDVVAARPDVQDLVDWTFPDGTRGLPLLSMHHPLYQVWRS